MQPTIVYRDPRPISGTVAVLLGVAAVLSVCGILLDAGVLDSLDRLALGGNQAEKFERAFASVVRLEQSDVVLWVLTGVAFVLWMRRAAINNMALGAKKMRHGPRAGYWFLVPLAHAIVPCLAVAEAWRASGRGRGETWKTNSTSPLVIAWWIAFVVSFVGGQLVFVIADWEDVESVQRLFRWDVGRRGGRVLAAILAVAVVLGISTRQRAKLHALETAENRLTLDGASRRVVSQATASAAPAAHAFDGGEGSSREEQSSENRVIQSSRDVPTAQRRRVQDASSSAIVRLCDGCAGELEREGSVVESFGARGGACEMCHPPL